ncbi:methionine ABC superfamily ATP binding cassette transporter, binding protein [Lentilactobacillus farraginis DSM 18382 = JCM 14108]|nr:methionine ABC superfamily ATP binding cassette transporter, binding protein [Lentilactobacillus farraginis DSM 18382 = JCM 14108]
MQQVKKIAAKHGLTINIKSFTDYNTPNSALNAGDIQASSFETAQFLKTQEKDKNYKFAKAFKTVALPMGIYSNKVKKITDLKKGAKIAVPNDATQEARALRIFQKAGILKLKSGVGEKATKNDLASNPKQLKIYELDASQIPKQLKEFDAAAINSNFALDNNLTLKQAIYHESLKNNAWPNYFVVKDGHQNDKVVKQIKKYYQSPEIKKYVKKEFKGALVPEW